MASKLKQALDLTNSNFENAQTIDELCEMLKKNYLSLELIPRVNFSTEIEIFKEIPNFNEYQVTSFGRVFSKKSNKFLKEWYTKSGYPVVSLCSNGTTVKVPLHRLISKIFMPNDLSEEMVINHLDGNRKNNHVNNLQWSTYSENSHHAHNTRLTKIPRGENHQNSKLTNEQVEEIKNLYPIINSYSILAKRYNVSVSIIGSIITGKRKTAHV